MRLRIAGLALLFLCPRLIVAAEAPPPFERTEDHPRCANYTATRQPFWGELHLHTVYSADAATVTTRNTPFDAYRYARGEKVGLPPFVDTRQVKVADAQPATGGVSAHPYCLPPDTCQYTATRTIQLPRGRALDFAAVTDHSEWLGESNICFFEGNVSCQSASDCATGQTCDKPPKAASGTCVPEGYSSELCTLARQALDRLESGPGPAAFIALVEQSEPKRFPYCLEGKAEGGTCTFQAKNVWQQIIAAAEQNYDRTPACKFTSFIGYEYTSMPVMNQCIQSSRPCFADADCGEKDRCAQRGQCSQPYGKTCYVANGTTSGCGSGATCVVDKGGNNLHRNIIFRNANVPAAPISYVEVPTGCGAGEDCRKYQGTKAYPMSAGAFSTAAGVGLGSPLVMLKTLRQQCNKSDPKHPCEFLSNPHNPNLSGGGMFLMPESDEDAKVRGELERLVEIFQIKGGSECRSSKRYPDAWQTGAFVPDELCDFENMSWAKLTGAYLVEPSPAAIPPSSYVRNVLKDGMRYQQQHGGKVNPFKLGSSAASTTTTARRARATPSSTPRPPATATSASRSPARRSTRPTSSASRPTAAASPRCGRRKTRATRSSPACSGARPTPPAAPVRWCASSAASACRRGCAPRATSLPRATPPGCPWAARSRRALRALKPRRRASRSTP